MNCEQFWILWVIMYGVLGFASVGVVFAYTRLWIKYHNLKKQKALK